MSLTFDGLRRANRARVGQFKNSKGEPAHTKADGSDWTVAQWFQAWLGEVGEFAQVRTDFEAGEIDKATYAEYARGELPDSVIYQDLLCMRALDETSPHSEDSLDPAQTLMYAIARIGTYANARKKFDRGDIDIVALQEIIATEIPEAIRALEGIADGDFLDKPCSTTVVHPTGIDMGQVVISKFNEVSDRVNSTVILTDKGSCAYQRNYFGHFEKL